MNEKKQKILEVGLTEFSKYSFEEGSLNKILNEACVSKGTFYHYFHDKMDLYLSLVAEYMDRKSQFLSFIDDDDLIYSNGDSFFDCIKKHTYLNIKFLQVEPEFYKFSVNLSCEGEDIKSKIREKFGWQLEGGIDDLIEVGYLKGEFDTKYPKGFIKNIVSFLSSHYYGLLFPKGEQVSEQAMQAMLDLYFDFIKDGFSNNNLK